MIKSNLHRANKHAIQLYATASELAIINAAKKKAKVTTNRELLLTLCEHYLAKP